MKSYNSLRGLVLFLFCGLAFAKECSNSLPQELQSHTWRAKLSTTNNETLKRMMVSSYNLAHSTAQGLPAAKVVKEEEDEDDKIVLGQKNLGDIKLPGDVLKEVSLHDVRLLPNSFHWQGQQTNLHYLLMLDVDRLVWNFRKEAGLQTPGTPYGGWESPTEELRGHFVGHYLSATAQAWASTHSHKVKRKMNALVSALFECQQKIGTGYLSAFPTEFFDRLEKLVYVWAPYYTIHKIMAGLLDQYLLADNGQALNMTIWMADYFNARVQNVIAKYSIERHYQTLNEESGGMNDVLYRLFGITKDPKHLKLAQLFDKPCFLGILAVQADNIADLHANTHIPLVSGVQSRYEVTGDELSRTMGTFFMDIINSSHSYATGGTSDHEFWADPKRLATTLSPETQESCTTYNMLKVSRNLFRWTKSITHADYYERALTNGVLGIQRGTDPGVMIYMLPLAPGSSKAKTYHSWGTPFDSFWCCYGTGIESFSKLGNSIYFEQEGKDPSLYIIQFVPSSLYWRTGQITLIQNVGLINSWDPNLRVILTFASDKGAAVSSSLNLRIPFWTAPIGSTATLNNENLPLPAPGNYLTVTRAWSPADKITIQLPINLWTEAIKDDRPEYASLQAIFYGPFLLAGHSGGDFEIQIGKAKSLSEWITPIPATYNDGLVTFTQQYRTSKFVLMYNQSVTMEPMPAAGTGVDVKASFRLILSPNSSPVKFTTVGDVIGKSFMLEPLDFPGMLLTQQGNVDDLVIANTPGNSVFRLNAGLNGSPNTVSLESTSRKGCFVYSGVNFQAGTSLKLSCNQEKAGFKQAASFRMQKGLSQYHPISFVAEGTNRNYLLAPLMSFRDESYTVYFDITAFENSVED